MFIECKVVADLTDKKLSFESLHECFVFNCVERGYSPTKIVQVQLQRF